MPVQALYVDPERGPYPAMLGAENCWGVARNAKNYAGPWSGVYHPPCGPWGALRWNCTKQDPECGPRAVEQIREFGGVLEHPRGSLLWKECGLPLPHKRVPMLVGREWALEVDQCDWGHRAQKRTWLLFVGVSPSDLPPMPPPGTPTRMIGTKAEARNGLLCLPKTERHLTPPAFAKWLIDCVTASQSRQFHLATLAPRIAR